MSESDGRSFRSVASALFRASLVGSDIDLGRGTFALRADAEASSTDPLGCVFEGVTVFKWQAPSGRSSASDKVERGVRMSVVGLERLADDQPWRLYLQLENGMEVEVACQRIKCDGEDVTGIGRAYKA